MQARWIVQTHCDCRLTYFLDAAEHRHEELAICFVSVVLAVLDYLIS